MEYLYAGVFFLMQIILCSDNKLLINEAKKHISDLMQGEKYIIQNSTRQFISPRIRIGTLSLFLLFPKTREKALKTLNNLSKTFGLEEKFNILLKEVGHLLGNIYPGVYINLNNILLNNFKLNNLNYQKLLNSKNKKLKSIAKKTNCICTIKQYEINKTIEENQDKILLEKLYAKLKKEETDNRIECKELYDEAIEEVTQNIHKNYSNIMYCYKKHIIYFL